MPSQSRLDHQQPEDASRIPAWCRLQACSQTGASLGDQYAAQVVDQGLRLPWSSLDPQSTPLWTFNQNDLPPQVGVLISEALREGVTSEIPFDQVKCLSQIFAIPKKEPGKWRLITNLRNLNPYLKTTYFQLPTLQKIKPFLQKGMWAAKIDLKAAYNHLPIHPEDRPWLCINYGDKFYKHNALPFGLSIAPREWQRLMHPIITLMRGLGCMLWIYLDDFLLLANSAYPRGGVCLRRAGAWRGGRRR